jgi:hypothetical protein
MPRSTPNKITLPSDGGNTGAKSATMDRTQGADTVTIPLMIPERREVVKGVYRTALPLQSVVAAAHNGTTTGFLWMFCPAAVTNRAMRLRRAKLAFQHSAVTAAMPTIPRIGLSRFTYTGTLSGAQVAGAKIDPDSANPSIDMRTASTGGALTLNTDPGSLLASVIVPPTLLLGTLPTSALIAIPNSEQELISSNANEDEWPMIKAGQGLVISQLDAATAADLRRFSLDILWDEIEI